MKMQIKGKKGELTTKQLVTIIILIVSFIIILFLIFRLNLGETSDKEICRNSVVLRGQSELTSGPLDCKTNYITISTENKGEIMKAIAEEMADCWWQFGEGKINYGVSEIFEQRVEYVICSIIDFNEKTQGKVSEISYSEFYSFLQTGNKSTSQTYLQYLYSISNVNSFSPQSQVQTNIAQDRILTNQKYSVITGIDNNPTPTDDIILKVYIIPTSETSSRLDVNREFITKS